MTKMLSNTNGRIIDTMALISCVCLTLVSAHSEGGLKVVYAVNAGGKEHTDKHGIHYIADPLNEGTASDYGNHLLMIGRVDEEDEVLYRTERYHIATFGYDIPIDGDGQYALIMKFCEVYFNEPLMKVFDVVLNKEHIVVSELDIFSLVGRGTAHDEYAFFSVVNDRLFYNDQQSVIRNSIVRLDFIKGDFDNPKINAFALLKGDVEHVPRLLLEEEDDEFIKLEPEANVIPEHFKNHEQKPAQKLTQLDLSDGDALEEELDDFLEEEPEKVIQEKQRRKTVVEADLENEPSKRTSGPPVTNPYTMDDTSIMLPVFIAIIAFIPLLFCLCKL